MSHLLWWLIKLFLLVTANLFDDNSVNPPPCLLAHLHCIMITEVGMNIPVNSNPYKSTEILNSGNSNHIVTIFPNCSQCIIVTIVPTVPIQLFFVTSVKMRLNRKHMGKINLVSIYQHFSETLLN